ncbi:MAG: hypothetical protein OXT67_11630 [Zetaproteobacteria bacterium]|nr:hypothetical protein [Zetaproteobacteria bacterium]
MHNPNPKNVFFLHGNALICVKGIGHGYVAAQRNIFHCKDLPDCYLGFIQHLDKHIPVVDTARLFGLPQLEQYFLHVVVTENTDKRERPFALAASDYLGVSKNTTTHDLTENISEITINQVFELSIEHLKYRIEEETLIAFGAPGI